MRLARNVVQLKYWRRHEVDGVLVRIRQHIFVPGRNAGRGRSGKSRRARDLETVPARTDLPGAGLRELAVLRVSGQGPVHVARPREAVCEIPPRLETDRKSTRLNSSH